jgi:hypothetical protein
MSGDAKQASSLAAAKAAGVGVGFDYDQSIALPGVLGGWHASSCAGRLSGV